MADSTTNNTAQKVSAEGYSSSDVTSEQRIVFVGGGSGGHFYPLIAIAESIVTLSNTKNTNPPTLYYIGPNEYDKAALDAYNILHISCPAGKRRKYSSVLNFFDFFKTFWGAAVAFIKLFIIYPDAIMSKGGYT
ncbi:MAG: UDP-N-acetylglucosamine--N-acetylmuramyl-(pentapeptide) pyrophosphoryl-undecaprenol N-acetylglucosamine transferase, partial [Psychromonas sp.]|nr:UDP-N-acetylglucosamine--N-acetylmuramyl-(pentapeptide) pyrophosphoryl-undecaprenol N-acetylglucosamine transferase [Psychromonas sp.]